MLIRKRRESAKASVREADEIKTFLFDPWYYSLQAGSFESDAEAFDHYRQRGAAKGLLPNPLTDVVRAGLTAKQVIAAIEDGTARYLPVRTWFDDLALIRRFASMGEHPGGVVGAYLAHAHAGAPVPDLAGMAWPRFVELRKQQKHALRRIRRSGTFDREFYQRSTGIEFLSTTQAIWHFLEEGEQAGLSPNVLYDREWYRGASRARRHNTYAYLLRAGQTRHRAGPHFASHEYAERHPEALDHPGGPLGHFMQNAGPGTATVRAAESTMAPTDYATLRAAMMQVADAFEFAPAPTAAVADWVMALPPNVAASDTPMAVVTDEASWPSPGLGPVAVADLVAQTHTTLSLYVVTDDAERARKRLAVGADSLPITWIIADSPEPAARFNQAVLAARESWVLTWHPGQKWQPDVLAVLADACAGGAAPDGACLAVEQLADGKEPRQVQLTIATGQAPLWQAPRSLAGMAIAARVLAANPARVQAGNQWAWDFLLRVPLDVAYVPWIGVSGSKIHAPTLASGLPDVDEHVVRAEHLDLWRAVDTGQGERVTGRTSLLIPTFWDHDMTRRAVKAALDGESGDVEVIVLDNGSPWQVSARLASVFAGDPRVRVRRVRRNTNFSTGCNIAFAQSTGDVAVFLNNDTLARKGWLEPLRRAAERPEVLGAQSLLLYADDSVQSAGTVFQGPHAVATALFASHPVEDVERVGPGPLQAITAACMAVTARRFAAARGFDPHYANGMEDVDLCLRLAQAEPGHFTTVLESRVTHLEGKTQGRSLHIEANRATFMRRWGAVLPGPQDDAYRAAGFEVMGRAAAGGGRATGQRTTLRPLLIRPARTVTSGPGKGLPSLRWAIKNPAPGDIRGPEWGDTYFAADLAAALRELGQEVVVDRRGAHQRVGSDHLDDVAVWIHGRGVPKIQPGITNLLWVISHPLEAHDDMLTQGFDRIYSAGQAWAVQTSRRLGLDVQTMWQATDPRRFSVDGPAQRVQGPLFVGNTRGVFRQIVRDCVDVGAAPCIVGAGWERFIDPGLVAGTHVSNQDLPTMYRGAQVVLNDHWADMAEHGFFNNRLFDAVACGARVLSDQVDGLDEVFGGSVKTYSSPTELASLLAPGSTDWPDEAQLRANAERIAREHSFASRARRMLDDVLHTRG